jgi:hypothetical protein
MCLNSFCFSVPVRQFVLTIKLLYPTCASRNTGMHLSPEVETCEVAHKISYKEFNDKNLSLLCFRYDPQLGEIHTVASKDGFEAVFVDLK